MRNFVLSLLALIFAFLGMTAFYNSADAGNNLQDDQLAHGKYIATIAGCTDCHTPFKAEYLRDPKTWTPEQIQAIAFNAKTALDEEKLLSGARAFDLGPAGVVYTRNLTPDKETGLGKWTDEQVKVAVKTGVSVDGGTLFPVMPYHTYNGMADADVDAVIAYLRSVKAISNKVPKDTVSKAGLSPIPFKSGIVAPDPADKAARGAYLINSVMACTDCHTPIDPATGAPMMDKYLAGGQPYEGPWGIVYGGNITPDQKTGIGSWTNEEVKRALVAGISKDGRRLILMPWFVYSAITKEDADAVVFYLKNGLSAVSNEVPVASLNPEFNVIVKEETPKSASPTLWIALGLIVVIIAGLGMFFLRRKPA
jgi:mono/diheme cytochrome c family protein